MELAFLSGGNEHLTSGAFGKMKYPLTTGKDSIILSRAALFPVMEVYRSTHCSRISEGPGFKSRLDPEIFSLSTS